MQVTVYAKVENIGWVPQYFDLVGGPENASPADFTLTVDQRGQKSEKSITAVEPIPGGIRVVPEEFSYNQEFTLTGSGAAEGISLTKKDVSNVEVEGMDKFAPLEENGIHYRLYSPKAGGPRPLILFLHGGGESGSDNFMQMVGTVGAIRLAELYPEMYVMAPQAPAGKLPIGLPSAQTFAGSVQDPDSGWNRSYLAGVCDLIRKMIAEGQVDASRVYVTGMSMGGGGTLRALSVGSGLFAAAVPICPTMTPETFNILKSLVDTKIWVAAAYVDHTIYRHKYIVDGILAIKDAGNPDAHLTIFSPEELAIRHGRGPPDVPGSAVLGEPRLLEPGLQRRKGHFGLDGHPAPVRPTPLGQLPWGCFSPGNRYHAKKAPFLGRMPFLFLWFGPFTRCPAHAAFPG